MEMKEALNKVQKVIQLKMTDQDLADLCPSLSAEDIHTIRQTDNLNILPFAAINELSIVGYEQEKKHHLVSPILQEEFNLFKDRMETALANFYHYQQEKFDSEQSQMDDEIIAQIVKEIYSDIINDEEILLSYFEYYQSKMQEI